MSDTDRDPTPLGAALAAQRRGIESTTDLVDRLDAVPDAAERMADVEVGTTPSEVVYEENKLTLHHYEPDPEDRLGVPILVVYALINRPYILDLQPDRSVVRTLIGAGYDVYLIDWGEPSTLDAELGLYDYVYRYVDNCVDVVRERTGRELINVLGYCMGGTMSAMYAALFPEKVANLGLMATGLCFEDSGGLLELWGDEQYYSPSEVADAFGNVPSEFLDVGFALMDPVENAVGKYVRLFENADDEEFVENFARMEQWIGDGIDVAGRAYVEFLEEIYQDNSLYENDLYLEGHHVDLDELDMPILQIVAEYDHLIPPSASKPFNDVVASDDTTIIEFPTGHIGMSVSSSSHERLWPQVCDWFAERSAAVDADAAVSGDATAEVETGTGADADADEEEEAVEIGIDDGDADDADVEVETETDAATDDEDLQRVDGIGPAYADRLSGAGVDSLSELAAADPEVLAERAGLGIARVEEWVAAAADLTD